MKVVQLSPHLDSNVHYQFPSLGRILGIMFIIVGLKRDLVYALMNGIFCWNTFLWSVLHLDGKRNIVAICDDFCYLTLASLEFNINAIHESLTKEHFQIVYLATEINTLILLFFNILLLIVILNLPM